MSILCIFKRPPSADQGLIEQLDWVLGLSAYVEAKIDVFFTAEARKVFSMTHLENFKVFGILDWYDIQNIWVDQQGLSLEFINGLEKHHKNLQLIEPANLPVRTYAWIIT